jgi:hypothetical protein
VPGIGPKLKIRFKVKVLLSLTFPKYPDPDAYSSVPLNTNLLASPLDTNVGEFTKAKLLLPAKLVHVVPVPA